VVVNGKWGGGGWQGSSFAAGKLRSFSPLGIAFRQLFLGQDIFRRCSDVGDQGLAGSCRLTFLQGGAQLRVMVAGDLPFDAFGSLANIEVQHGANLRPEALNYLMQNRHMRGSINCEVKVLIIEYQLRRIAFLSIAFLSEFFRPMNYPLELAAGNALGRTFRQQPL
jgi:hypothetical protein